MPTPPRPAVVVALLVLLPASASGAEPNVFAARVRPFLAAHCEGCHAGAKPAAGFAVPKLDADLLAGPDAKKWRAVLERVAAGEMPPEGEPRPKPADVKAVAGWLEGELARAEAAAPGRTGKRAGDHLPQYGNRLDHAALFGVTARTTPDAPPRVWRVSPYIYAEWVRAVGGKGFGGDKGGLPQAFAVPPGRGFKDYAADGGLDEPTAAQLVRNAEAMVAHQTRAAVNGKVPFGAVKDFVALLDPAREPAAGDVRAAVARQFQIGLRRPPTADEADRFAALLRKNVLAGGREEGVRATLAAVLLLPEAVFRSERGAGPPDADGLVRLTPREIAFAVGYALGDKGPDAALLASADAGRLATPDDVARELARLWADPKFDRPRVPRFVREYFEYHLATDVFKDDKENPHHDARLLVADTDRLVNHVLAADRDVFRELLTTEKSFVAYTVDNKTKAVVPAGKGNKKQPMTSYNVTAETWSGVQPMRLPAKERAGILTQPSWLVAHSLNADNHAILRGKWVRERLLGGSVPDLPITVDAQLPDDPKRTLRDRMGVTKDAYCWKCHRKMNDLGLPFEAYDHFGRFRTEEKGKPVDSTGLVAHAGDPALDGPVPDAAAMIRKLAATDRARQVFVRHAFRYWMGRNETPGDAWSLVRADRAYVESGGSLKALVTSILTSDSFLLRRVK